MWWKRHKWKVVAAAAVVLALAVAFWYGGDAPDSRGWTLAESPTPTAGTEPAPDQTGTPTPTPPASPSAPAAAGEEETAEVTGPPAATPTPTATPVPSAEPTPPAETAMPSPSPAGTEAPAEAPEDEGFCTLSVSCATLLENPDALRTGTAELLPADGWILAATEVSFAPGESVFDVLLRACRAAGVHLEYSSTPLYQSAYIEGIGNLYEFDAGELSGWTYRVNGVFPGYGCSRYVLEDGDTVEFLYTLNQGADVGNAGPIQ